MSKRNGREKGVTVSYVDCSSRKTVLSRVGRLVPEKKLEELFPRDEKGAVDDAVYAEIKGLLASGWSFSGQPPLRRRGLLLQLPLLPVRPRPCADP